MSKPKAWSFNAQITGSVRVSQEGDIYPKISIPFEESRKLPNWVDLTGEVVEVTIKIKGS